MAGFTSALVRQVSIVLAVSLGLLVGLVLLVGGALAAPPEVFVDESANAVLHGNSNGFHYRIEFFAGQTTDSGGIPNAAVEVEVFDSAHNLLDSCFAGEKTLDAPASLNIATGLKTAVFDGVYADSGCFWGDASFDLYWTARGKLINENSRSGEPGEFCHDRYQERSAAAAGTVQFSAGPSTSQFVVESESASIFTESQTRCLMPGPPQPA